MNAAHNPLVNCDDFGVDDEVRASSINNPMLLSVGYRKGITQLANSEYTQIVESIIPVCLTWHNLTVTSTAPGDSYRPPILNSLNGSIYGSSWAVMGSSGSGKSTFLNCLASRIEGNRMKVTGTVLVNSITSSQRIMKSLSAYVPQDDVLHSNLTVHEILDYSSRLLLPNNLTDSQRFARVNKVIDLMKISCTRDVVIGDSRRKGISGGERKRVCIAIALLSKPQLLFLDEPTSGNEISVLSGEGCNEYSA